MAINKRIAKPTAIPAIAPLGSGDLLDESGSEGVDSGAGDGKASVEHEDEPSGAVEHSGVGKINWICLASTRLRHTSSDRIVVVVTGALPSTHTTSSNVVTSVPGRLKQPCSTARFVFPALVR